MKVCIDPGHQLHPDLTLEPIAPDSHILKPRTAPGTAGLWTKTQEYEIVLQIALLTESRLLQRSCEVVLTRRINEVKLSNIERANIANSSGADFCLKLHCNGVRHVLRYITFWKRGAMTLIPAAEGSTISIHQPSLMIAHFLHKSILEATEFPDLGIHTRTDLSGFNWSQIPVVLLELGYLTNPIEESYLVDKSFQANISTAIARGVVMACESLQPKACN
jgi:N-acetylmuramoyl-L-alanine amidase